MLQTNSNLGCLLINPQSLVSIRKHHAFMIKVSHVLSQWFPKFGTRGHFKGLAVFNLSINFETNERVSIYKVE